MPKADITVDEEVQEDPKNEEEDFDEAILEVSPPRKKKVLEEVLEASDTKQHMSRDRVQQEERIRRLEQEMEGIGQSLEQIKGSFSKIVDAMSQQPAAAPKPAAQPTSGGNGQLDEESKAQLLKLLTAQQPGEKPSTLAYIDRLLGALQLTGGQQQIAQPTSMEQLSQATQLFGAIGEVFLNMMTKMAGAVQGFSKAGILEPTRPAPPARRKPSSHLG